MITYDIHLNKDNVDTALYNLNIYIKHAKREKDRFLLFITGYGSKGKTHKILTSVLDKLEEYKSKNIIKDYIKGEDVKELNIKYLEFLKNIKSNITPDVIKCCNIGNILIKV